MAQRPDAGPVPHRPRPRPLAPAVATRSELIALGWTDSQIRQEVRTGRWRRAIRGSYITDANDPGHERAFVAAVLDAHGEEAVLILHSAARVHELEGVWPADPRVHVCLPPGRERHQQRGVVLHTRILKPAEVIERDGLRVTSAARTVVDLVCSMDRLAAVSVIDSALHRGLLTSAEVDQLRRRTVRRRGARRSRSWWAESDHRAESPLETRVRLLARDAGFPPTTLQLPVVRDGSVVAYGDLAWRQPNGRWLIGEADGAQFHDTPRAVFRDRVRANLIASGGDTDIVRFTWHDTLRRPTVGPTLARFLN